jgi:hypothetical protein
MKERQSRDCASEPPPPSPEFQLVEDDNVDLLKDRDFEVLTSNPARNLIDFADLFDRVIASDDKIHAALFWPHIPPRATLPWMLREVIPAYGRDVVASR